MLRKKKIISAITAVVLLCSILPFSVLADGKTVDFDSQNEGVEKKISENIEKCIGCIECDKDTSIVIDKIKFLRTFNDKIFFAVEFENAGYLICSSAGDIAEYSLSSPSPYYLASDNLYYSGPLNYYSFQDGTYINVLTGACFDSNDESFYNSSLRVSEELTSNFSFSVLDTCCDYDYNIDILNSILSGEQLSIQASSSTYYIPGYSKISSLITRAKMGYMDGGVCGYIAAGLLMYWFDEYCSYEKLINDFSFINSNSSGFRGENFTHYLRNFGSSNSTDAAGYASPTSMARVILDYCDHISYNVSSQHTLLPSESRIKTWLLEQKSPYIVFGHLKDPSQDDAYVNHAVLAYGYNSNGIIVHFGWSGYSCVTLSTNIVNNTYGSGLGITGISSHSVQMTDTPSSYWAYTAAQYCARYHIIPTIANQFRGTESVTRGVFVNALYQLAGAPRISNAYAVECQFSDLSSSSLYHDAAVWAYQNGILTGTTSTTLSLNNTLTREQAAVFLYRFSNTLGCHFSDTAGPSASSFNDYSNIGNFAVTAMNWATHRYLINGNNGALNPKAPLSRAEAATIIYRLVLRATY